jgi:dephospho-CoA kinase
MLYVGLTGNIGSGKTEVANRLQALGATVIDADVLAREVVEPGTPGLHGIVERWGHEVLQADGTLDRQALRRRVFGHPQELAALNAIVHPAVEARRHACVAEAEERGDPVVVYVVPLLFENDLAGDFDKVIFVDAPAETRLDRLVQHRGLPRDEAARIMAAQMSPDQKRPHADFVIPNRGSLQELHQQVDLVWERLTAQNTPPSLAI